MTDLFRRIRQARLFRIAAVYLAIAWVILQVADVLEDTLELPSWVSAAALLLLAAGLLVVMATAWLQAHPPAPPEADGRVTPAERVLHGWVLPQLTWRRAAWGGSLSIVALLLVGWFAVIGPRPERVLADAAGAGLAVLPFDVSGADSALWREGMLDLLATNLDGVAGVRTIDPAAVLARDPGPGAGTAERVSVARDMNARWALLGRAVRLGASVRLLAEVHDATSGDVVARAHVEGPSDSLLALVDALSVDVVRQFLSGDAGAETTLRNAEAVTTRSHDALRAYLEGEQLYRRNDIVAASRAYERALRADSTFALALWGWALANGWQGDAAATATRDTVTERLEALAHRLPERTRMLLNAELLRRRGDTRSIPLFEAATVRYPDDPGAWYLLGEALFHLGYDYMPEDGGLGVSLRRTAEPFVRAIELDPTTGPYYYHAVHLLYLIGDTITGDRLSDAYVARFGEALYVDRWRALRHLMRPDVLADSMRLDSAFDAGGMALVDDVSLLPDARLIGGIARVLRRQGAPDAQVDNALSASLVLEGRLEEAIAVTASQSVEDQAIVLAMAHYIGAPPSAAQVARLLQPETDGGRVAFFAGVDAWLSDDAPRLHRAIEVLEATAADADPTAFALHELPAAQARVLRSLERYDAGDRAVPDTLMSILPTLVRPRVGRGHGWTLGAIVELIVDMLIADGRAQEARRWLEPMSEWRVGLNVLRRAQVAEQLGEVEEAARLYALFLEEWRNADPGLPRLDQARRALERLRIE